MSLTVLHSCTYSRKIMRWGIRSQRSRRRTGQPGLTAKVLPPRTSAAHRNCPASLAGVFSLLSQVMLRAITVEGLLPSCTSL